MNYLVSRVHDEDEPTMKEALNCHNKQDWEKDMSKEIYTLKNMRC